MRQKTTYVCEHCGKEFNNARDCMDCESNHVMIYATGFAPNLKFHDSVFNKGEMFPYHSIVAFDDGSFAVYESVISESKNEKMEILVNRYNIAVNTYTEQQCEENKKAVDKAKNDIISYVDEWMGKMNDPDDWM